MSLASFAALMITAVRMSEGRNDLRGITHVRWETDYAVSEESSVEDLIHWLNSGSGRAYIQLPDGTRGPHIEIAGHGRNLYITSAPDDESLDALLTLRRLNPSRPHRPAHRRSPWRTAPHA